MLAENVSIEEQLTKMANGVARLSSENVEMNETFNALLAEQMRLEQDHIMIATRSSAAMKLTHLLTIHQHQLDDLIEEADEGQTAVDHLERECKQLEAEEVYLSKCIHTMRSKCEDKQDRLCAVHGRLKSRGDWIGQTSSTIDQAARFIQALIIEHSSSEVKENEEEGADEQKTTEKTKAVIQSVLNALMSIRETGKSRPQTAAISHEHTVTTIDSLNFVLAVEQDSSYEFTSSEDDDDSRNSEISDPHSSRAEDTELEVSEPEDDQPISFVVPESDTQVEQAQKLELISSPTVT
ncbi:hypothetical protein AHF37_10757 [Paragonimus kellicotti]|nr:hypothetical protein AHF37_10757 [Paragonimus kellicotti]